MTPGRRQRIEALVEGALARGVTERTAFLDTACAGDADLRRDVESLLAGQSAAGELFERPAWPRPRHRLRPARASDPTPAAGAVR